jgi:sugar lactone lactonase YvrE
MRSLLLSAALLCPGACEAQPDTGDGVAERGPLGKADLTGTCIDGDQVYCGGPSAGTCFCDAECETFGDCCTDAAASCFAPEGPQLLLHEGLHAPESVVLDPQTRRYYVSNLAHNILETDPTMPPPGNLGYVSLHAEDGSLLQERWAEGLSSPKGITIDDGIVYVADPKFVVALDADTGKEVARYTETAAGLFNDVTPFGDGTLLVTDTANPGLLRLDPRASKRQDTMTEIVRDPRFEFPNGVAVDGDTAYVSTTGIFPSEAGPGTLGRVFAVNLATGELTELEGLRGRWDGAVVMAGHVVVNDFMEGSVHAFDLATGEREQIAAPFVELTMPPNGIADMNAAGAALLIPSMFTNEVYRMTPSLSATDY